MFKDLLTKIKTKNKAAEVDIAQRKIDEDRLDAMSSYLMAKFSYTQDGVKTILRGAINGKFNIDSKADRDLMLNTLYDVINLETVNKYNNMFLDLTNHLRAPLVVVTDLTQISLNNTKELAIFITAQEATLVFNFNEEAKHVNTNFNK